MDGDLGCAACAGWGLAPDDAHPCRCCRGNGFHLDAGACRKPVRRVRGPAGMRRRIGLPVVASHLVDGRLTARQGSLDPAAAVSSPLDT
jgi:hypothetical protein